MFIEVYAVIRLNTVHFVLFQFPVETYGYAVLFSLSGYLGLYIVLTLVKSFGALIAVTGRLYVCFYLVSTRDPIICLKAFWSRGYRWQNTMS